MSALPITYTFRAPCEHLNANQAEHWTRRRPKVKAWRAASCAAAIRYVGQPCPPADIHVRLDVHDNRRRDPANWMPTIKAVVDGMTAPTTTTRKGRTTINVGASLWPDDTPEWITTHEPTFRVVPRGQAKCVTVTLTERAA